MSGFKKKQKKTKKKREIGLKELSDVKAQLGYFSPPSSKPKNSPISEVSLAELIFR